MHGLPGGTDSMTAAKRWFVWIAAALAGTLVVATLYAGNRGGHYPTYPVSSFSQLALPAVAVKDAAAAPVVQVSSGALRGSLAGTAVAYRGIPYAQPPTGQFRWQPPRPPLSWQGVRDAEQPGSACTQPASGLTPFFDPMARAYGSRFEQAPTPSSEDCLYLDVWTPGTQSKPALPVMVWLHGGSNTFGSGAQPMYNGSSLVQRGVLLVTINYRLGAMGFMSHPGLTAESPHHSSGNYGLLDQLAALAWVKQNIAGFGGDPDNVTLFGESAGAIDAARLMTSPLAVGLFKRVISESGPAFVVGHTLAEAEAIGSAVAALAPAGRSATALETLRSLPASEVETLAAQTARRSSFDITEATADGWILPASPQQAFLAGRILKTDLLIGLNARELSAFRLASAAVPKSPEEAAHESASAGLADFSKAARPYFGIWTRPALGLYLSRILLNRNAGLDGAANDLLVACPTGAIASLTQAAGSRVFVYRFDRAIPGAGENALGAFHGLEVPYVFGTLGTEEWRWLPATPDDARLSDLLQTYWTNFAKSGDPNRAGLPAWPAWNDRQYEFLVVNRNASVTSRHRFPPLFARLSAARLKQDLTAP
jgi:para-nitrobenzyl esterase